MAAVPRGLPYVVGAQLGAGGYASVWRATPAAGGAAVALKLVPGGNLGADVLSRLRREAALATQIRHPNVVAVLDFGETDDGGAYLAMQLLEGESLDLRVSRGPLALEEVVRVGIEAAAGLGALHARDIVHRDVKPGNLFRCTDGSIRLLDLGLALPLGERGGLRLTAPNLLAGTPAYMAPEQADGSRHEGPWTDVWGLGATLYELANGRAPFHATTVTGALVRILTDTPDPMHPSIPAWLRAVILRALARRPAERWADVGQLARALAAGATTLLEPDRVVDLAQEVRIVSVLLADRHKDPASLRSIVEARGGTFSLLLGGRAIGIFGGADWVGDEAERAVRAALEARDAGVASRLAVATARGVTAGAGTVTGEVVALAERHLSERAVGIDAMTATHVAGGFEVEDGLVVAARPGRRVVGVYGMAGADVPMVGRDVELAQLVSALRRVTEDGEAAGQLVVGAPGIGKTTLVRALARRVDAIANQVTYLEGRCEPGTSPDVWQPFTSAFRVQLEIPERTPPAAVRDKLLAACPSQPCAAFMGELLGAPFPETPHLQSARADVMLMRHRIEEAIGEYVAALLATGPVVLVVENLHAGSQSTVDVLARLLTSLASRPLYVLATARPELAHDIPELGRVSLGGISRQATSALLRACGGDPSRSGEIHERSGGVPFFVEELARASSDEGGDLPATIEAAIQARLDALPREEKDLLRRASVLGEAFPASALVATGEIDPAGRLQSLRRRDLLSLAANPVEPEWRFRHAVVREVAYASLTEEQRRRLHGRVATFLAATPQARADTVARHFELAGDGGSAAPHWARAARSALAVGDPDAVLAATARALELGVPAPVAVDLRSVRIEALHWLGRRDEEGDELDALGRSAGNGPERAAYHELCARRYRLISRYADADRHIESGKALDPSRVGLLIEEVFALLRNGNGPAALRAGQAALDVAAASRNVLLQGRAMSVLAYLHSRLGDVSSAFDLRVRSLEAYEIAGDPRRAAAERGSLAYYALVLGRYDGAVTALTEAAAACEAAGNRSGQGFALQNLGLALGRAGRFEDALQALRRAKAIADGMKHERLSLACLHHHALLLVEAGDPAGALAVLDAEAGRTSILSADSAEVIVVRALALVTLGRFADAKPHIESALELRQTGKLEEREAELFLAAHAAGLEGALEQGYRALIERAELISDAASRTSFLDGPPAHRRLLEAAAAAGLGSPDTHPP